MNFCTYASGNPFFGSYQTAEQMVTGTILWDEQANAPAQSQPQQPPLLPLQSEPPSTRTFHAPAPEWHAKSQKLGRKVDLPQ